MCGGTGLYIKAFREGLDEIPAIDEGIRKKIAGQYHDRELAGCRNLCNLQILYFMHPEK